MEITEAKQLKVSLRDVINQRAYIRFSPDAKIALCHKAGAPWAEKNPNAQLSDLQKQVLSRRERHKIIHGASRLGKSVLGGCEGIIDMMLPFQKVAYVAARYDHVAAEWQYLYKGLKNLFGDRAQAFQRIVYKHQANYHEYDVHTIWGSRARGYSVEVDEGEVLLGQEFTRVICGEGSRIPVAVGDKRIKRAIDGALMNNETLRKETGYLSIYTTPSGYDGLSSSEWDKIEKQTRGKLERLHYGRVAFAESYWVREADALENPAYDRAVYEARKREMDPAAFDEQYRGLRVHTTGRVYREFREGLHVVSMPDKDHIKTMRFGIGIDTGSCFGAVLKGVDAERVLWTLGEVYTEKSHIRESCLEVRHMIEAVLGSVFDTTEYARLADLIDIWVIDPASQHKTEVSEYLGDICLELPGRNMGRFELLPTIDQMRQLMEQGRNMVADSCENWIDQAKKWTWKRTKTGNSAGGMIAIREPIKAFDHVLDADRFVTIPLEELGPRTEPLPSVSLKDAVKQEQRERIFGPLRDMLQRGEDQGGTWC